MGALSRIGKVGSKKFCNLCGQKLIYGLDDKRFDQHTGKPYFVDGKCPSEKCGHEGRYCQYDEEIEIDSLEVTYDWWMREKRTPIKRKVRVCSLCGEREKRLHFLV